MIYSLLSWKFIHHMTPTLPAFPDDGSQSGRGGFENGVAVSTSVERELDPLHIG